MLRNVDSTQFCCTQPSPHNQHPCRSSMKCLRWTHNHRDKGGGVRVRVLGVAAGLHGAMPAG